MNLSTCTRAALALLPALLGAGCPTPLVHPLRATNGPIGELSLGLGPTAGRRGSCDNTRGCVDSPAGAGATGNFVIPQLSLGYGHVLWGHVGLQGGVYFPAWENQKRDEVWAGLAAYTFVTFQTDHLSYGLGPEVGFGGVAMTVGGEVRSSPAFWHVAIGGYGRWFYPFRETHLEYDPATPTREWGVRLAVGPLYVQYSHLLQREGVMYWLLFETASYAQGLHNVSIGVRVDLDTVRWMATASGAT